VENDRSLYVGLEIAYVLELADVVAIHGGAMVQEGGVYVQQLGMLSQGCKNGSELLLHNAGGQTRHAVAEFVWVGRLRRGSGKRHGQRSS